jgi:hypothetical protein
VSEPREARAPTGPYPPPTTLIIQYNLFTVSMFSSRLIFSSFFSSGPPRRSTSLPPSRPLTTTSYKTF